MPKRGPAMTLPFQREWCISCLKTNRWPRAACVCGMLHCFMHISRHANMHSLLSGSIAGNSEVQNPSVRCMPAPTLQSQQPLNIMFAFSWDTFGIHKRFRICYCRVGWTTNPWDAVSSVVLLWIYHSIYMPAGAPAIARIAGTVPEAAALSQQLRTSQSHHSAHHWRPLQQLNSWQWRPR